MAKEIVMVYLTYVLRGSNAHIRTAVTGWQRSEKLGWDEDMIAEVLSDEIKLMKSQPEGDRIVSLTAPREYAWFRHADVAHIYAEGVMERTGEEKDG